MNKIRQILRGHFEGRGTKQLSQITGVSRNTIKSYLQRFKDTRLTYQDVEQLSDEALSELILGPPAPQQQSKRQEILSALLPAISKELRRKGMTSSGFGKITSPNTLRVTAAASSKHTWVNT